MPDNPKSLSDLEHEVKRLQRRLDRQGHNLEADLHAAHRAAAILDHLRKGTPSPGERELIPLIEADHKQLLARAHAARQARQKERKHVHNLQHRIAARKQRRHDHRHHGGAMFDSVDLDQFPSDPRAVAGYTSGLFPTYPELQSHFPGALKLSIAISALHDADCLDIEPGDASPADAAAWVRRQHARGLNRPAVYSSISSMAIILHDLAGAGIGRHDVNVWTAHYTFVGHRCGPDEFGLGTTADATQFTDKSEGRNLDESQCSATIPWHR